MCGIEEEKAPTLTCTHYGEPAVCYAFEPGITKRDGGDSRVTENVTPTLRSNMGDNQTAVAYAIKDEGFMDFDGGGWRLR